MRILLVMVSYPPEVSSTANLMAELAEDLAVHGHDVTALTVWPERKSDETVAPVALDECSVEKGVRVIRVKTLPMYNVGFVKRGLGTLLSPFQLWRALKRYDKRPFDATFVHSAPITFAQVGAWAKREGARFVFNVQDIFPQNAIELGILTNPIAIALFRWIEKRAYRAADVITAHSTANKAQLAAMNPSVANKLRILDNWIDVGQYAIETMTEDFRKTYGLAGKFVAVYGGVIGVAQDVGAALDIAARVRDLKDLVFLIVGDGSEKATMEARVEAEGLTNVQFRPVVSRERYPSLLHSSDIGFMTLSAKMKTPVVPGKILGYMAAGLPVVAFVNKESDAHAIIADARCGWSCTPDAVEEGAAIMRKVYADRMEAAVAGARGRAYVKAHFTKEVVIDQIVEMFRRSPQAADA